MKTAISIPADLFEGAQRFARRLGKSRSRVFSDAMREYLARHSPDEITEALNKVCSDVGPEKDSFAAAAARRALRRVEW